MRRPYTWGAALGINNRDLRNLKSIWRPERLPAWPAIEFGLGMGIASRRMSIARRNASLPDWQRVMRADSPAQARAS